MAQVTEVEAITTMATLLFHMPVLANTRAHAPASNGLKGRKSNDTGFKTRFYSWMRKCCNFVNCVRGKAKANSYGRHGLCW